MKNDFTPYEQAVSLKQLGFDKPCFGYYVELKNPQEGLLKIGLDNDFLQAPTFSQAFRFFREKFGYYANLFVDDDKTFGFMISSFVEEGVLEKPIQRNYSSYEEAELACLIKLIEIK